jgi:hypothetical protein
MASVSIIEKPRTPENVPQSKRCRACATHKPLSDFYSYRPYPSRSAPRYDSRCKSCTHNGKTSTKPAIPCTKPRASGPRDTRETWLRRRYKISVQTYNNMLQAQGGLCAICRQSSGNRNLHVDHCHETGKVRGLLCVSCNTGLGKLKDSPTVLRAAIEYLLEHGQT